MDTGKPGKRTLNAKIKDILIAAFSPAEFNTGYMLTTPGFGASENQPLRHADEGNDIGFEDPNIVMIEIHRDIYLKIRDALVSKPLIRAEHFEFEKYLRSGWKQGLICTYADYDIGCGSNPHDERKFGFLDEGMMKIIPEFFAQGGLAFNLVISIRGNLSDFHRALKEKYGIGLGKPIKRSDGTSTPAERLKEICQRTLWDLANQIGVRVHFFPYSGSPKGGSPMMACLFLRTTATMKGSADMSKNLDDAIEALEKEKNALELKLGILTDTLQRLRGMPGSMVNPSLPATIHRTPKKARVIGAPWLPKSDLPKRILDHLATTELPRGESAARVIAEALNVRETEVRYNISRLLEIGRVRFDGTRRAARLELVPEEPASSAM